LQRLSVRLRACRSVPARGGDSLIVRERVRPLLAVDPEVEIVAAAAIDKAKQLLDSGAIAQAEFDAIGPRRSCSAYRS